MPVTFVMINPNEELMKPGSNLQAVAISFVLG